ncbi:MAG: carboxypeptidase-like regulatory domain-containing protein [Polaribacter sp.]|uniref:carboxypeptidase-like regulatory domain-containing protein n=1 Tax=Polaribacter sp. TaxID=1920175 RepID=UPI003BB170A0
MKTIKKITFKKSTVILFGLFVFIFLFSESFQAQEIEVKGIVKGKTATETEILNGANINLKGTKVFATSNKKGEFTFPKKLKIGDVLVFSYLGYVKKSIEINKDSDFINILLLEDDNEMLGALNSNKRYSSKNKKQE